MNISEFALLLGNKKCPVTPAVKGYYFKKKNKKMNDLESSFYCVHLALE